jgi:site-specific DNA recombinase
MNHLHGAAAPKVVRCAIYTRKSTEEGLDQEFNSLDAQREAGEAYIASQRHDGWLALPERYDDGGFTGGNMNRPALTRLLDDIAQGHIDCVVTYKVDRLSRSLLDFAKMMACFEKHQVSFVSVTQQFNTASSMGRLILNVLLSFAQFERELIAERTRDKIAAARRKGLWVGGMPLLGYDVVEHGSKLRVNPREAERVRMIFALYLEHRALPSVIQELNRRGWRTKRWSTRKGHPRGGRQFTRGYLRRVLTSTTYLGQIRYRNEVYPGEHPAIVDAALWQQVQALLQDNRHIGGARRPPGALLQGILRCAPCGCPMNLSRTTKGNRRYSYYVCAAAQKRGWQVCPAPSVPAGMVERLVLQHLAAPDLDLAVPGETSAWEALSLADQVERLRRLIAGVDYDGVHGKLAIAFQPGVSNGQLHPQEGQL